MRFQLTQVDYMKRPMPNQPLLAEDCEEKPGCGALVLDDPFSRQLHHEFHETTQVDKDEFAEATHGHEDLATLDELDELKKEIADLHAMYDTLTTDPAAGNRSKVSRS
jgi:hypothetical protein